MWKVWFYSLKIHKTIHGLVNFNLKKIRMNRIVFCFIHIHIHIQQNPIDIQQHSFVCRSHNEAIACTDNICIERNLVSYWNLSYRCARWARASQKGILHCVPWMFVHIWNAVLYTCSIYIYLRYEKPLTSLSQINCTWEVGKRPMTLLLVLLLLLLPLVLLLLSRHICVT